MDSSKISITLKFFLFYIINLKMSKFLKLGFIYPILKNIRSFIFFRQ
ncbi:hypothetical protein AXA84_0262 [Candidatus Phytoplasma oryzae]|uniref:Uncharacterized protein n=1 Tax=Candidatus Phytoplasma oryzae TaxID=203274 RepID=A0A139JQI9_9MOLU|nr:hypothetical protein [Candidatus Phytoplasma oryzae]KXT29233.1 hypothetical protein AXA84_0262 [Candidatus Phytoplasma oryzae]